MAKSKRYVGEVVVLTRDCDLGAEGERAVVTAMDTEDGRTYMRLTFFNRPFGERMMHTGADYAYLTGTDDAPAPRKSRTVVSLRVSFNPDVTSPERVAATIEALLDNPDVFDENGCGEVTVEETAFAAETEAL